MSSESESQPKGVLDHIIFYAGAVAMLTLFGVVIYSVAMRYLLNRPPLWSVDVPNLLFIWLVFITGGLTAKLGPQIRVVFFLEKMSPATQKWLNVASHLAVLLMIAAFIWFSIPIIELSSGETTLSTGWNGSLFFYALPVGSVIMAYYQIQELLKLFRSKSEASSVGKAT